jgi:hypothetical protein
MKIYELRKIKSNNKKYKYIYQLIVEGEIVTTRRTSIEYLGIWIEGAPKYKRYHWFQESGVPFALAQVYVKKADLALTFSELVKYANLDV